MAQSRAMTEIEALHAAARHYCMDNFLLRACAYSVFREDGILPEGLGPQIYPRYNVLEAIREGVEFHIPGDFRNLSDARAAIIEAGQGTSSMMTGGDETFWEEKEEREAFCDYIRRLTTSDLRLIEPLPYRRTLSQDEHETLWEAVSAKWEIDTAYWHPLKVAEVPANVLGLQSGWFEEEVPIDALRRILAKRGYSRIYEFREYGASTEIDIDLLNAQYTGAEGYWTAGDFDWIIYASHESSITFGGDWLIEQIKEAWPNWESRLYEGWDYDFPPNYVGKIHLQHEISLTLYKLGLSPRLFANVRTLRDGIDVLQRALASRTISETQFKMASERLRIAEEGYLQTKEAK